MTKIREPVMELDVSEQEALAMAATGLEAAEELEAGEKIHICILGADGRIRMLLSSKGAPLRSRKIAIGKAKTARFYYVPSQAMQKKILPGQPLCTIDHVNDEHTFVQGGIPIVFNAKIFGSIGISGLKPENDEKVGNAMITKLNLLR